MGTLKLGEYLREQRRSAQLSLRQLADAAGVSNPYLSQIERGLRKPSAEILQQLAKALRISAETLYVQAGILDARERDALEVPAAILTDPSINERQKQVLIQIYESFRKENAAAAEGNPVPEDPAAGDDAGGERGDQDGREPGDPRDDHGNDTKAGAGRHDARGPVREETDHGDHR
ncbi:helix-turn-helix domain-containing protein [Actinacidiphila acididurans]|uniref:Helix-turn-helix transcriptional regulator n=1 Tax=Actinacidiphila acididurans TaxID=2784346 RepID=A0ABS2TYU3_9ACTN|nr:helix-turn-helix transcriptional regulator [Actinacidiphila acididurans]MBM9508489.1 helix-turn-helix transcriptional regulator [Actinacidiphila acididurans]